MSRASDMSDAAAQWLVRLEGQTTPEIWDSFQEWMDQDPRHRAAFIRLAGTVQIFLSKSISDHRVPKISPDRAAVRMHNSSASAEVVSRFLRLAMKAATAS